MPDTVDLTIRFPSREAMIGFCEWLSDAGGEQDFFESSETHEPEHAIKRFQYHTEDPQYPVHDGRRYGQFMADNLIIAHSASDS